MRHTTTSILVLVLSLSFGAVGCDSLGNGSDTLHENTPADGGIFCDVALPFVNRCDLLRPEFAGAPCEIDEPCSTPAPDCGSPQATVVCLNGVVTRVTPSCAIPPHRSGQSYLDDPTYAECIEEGFERLDLESDCGCVRSITCVEGRIHDEQNCLPVADCGGFEDVCASDADCAEGEACVDGACAAPIPGACASDADCGEGAACVSGLCVAPAR